MPPPTSTGGMEYTGADDVTMATASPSRDDVHEERLSLRVTNASTLPAAPRYSGSTMKVRRAFMRAFQTYVHALSAFDTSYGKPFVMPVSGCIEDRTCRLICMYELRNDPNLVTE
ncbi:hypothetical protein PHYSODRAFT_293357 [Phytophthora sojae]|uniref:Uncharacterized protein n=1 Tax=Phytophthora sojae (strain P6497) TaxID=1094619 RepID=G4YI92_PHYSP|nr:hypothetical protein PHYSODRAFT_293357 [Phytophthora sojae]EGZ27475.1 hypothetical protein PHYSODRAFT_293357 [Phytophthora sojae]|eukprot:XP_009514750.1 hypothetical protein PHYSODRAFT_293357 [Phytophthora sojae]